MVGRGEVSACEELERTSNSVFTCIQKKPSVLFCYCYMALILKFKSFILVSQVWNKKERRETREKRKIYCVFHMISVATITWLASSYFNGDDDSQC